MKKVLLLLLFISFSAFSQEETSEEVKFETIEQVPLFASCEDVEKSQQIQCFQDRMTQHIILNFKYPNKAARKNIQGRVLAKFIIDKEGNVTNIEATGGHKILQEEAIRIIKKLPQMKPGMQKGKPVRVQYGIPIVFKLK